jgi:hypothetical protein
MFATGHNYSTASASGAVTTFCILAGLAAFVIYGVFTPGWWRSWSLWPKETSGWVACWFHMLELLLFALVIALRLFPIDFYNGALSGVLWLAQWICLTFLWASAAMWWKEQRTLSIVAIVWPFIIVAVHFLLFPI